MKPLSSLDSIADGASLDSLSAIELAALLARLGAVQARVAGRLTALAQDGLAPDGDRLLDAREAAARLGVSATWLYRRKALPFAVRLGGHLRFSERGIDKFIRARTGGQNK